MKKPAVSLESLDARFENLDAKFESLDNKIDISISFLDTKIDLLDKKIDLIDFKFEKKIDSLDKKIDTIDFKFDSKIDALDKKIDTKFDESDRNLNELFDFIKENMMLRTEIKDYVDDRIESKFTKYASDQFEFQDRVGKRCENNEQENLILHHRVTLIEKHVGI